MPPSHGLFAAHGKWIDQKRGSSWSYVLELGLDPATGKRRQQMKGGFRTKKEAEAALRSVGVASDEGRHVTTSKMSVSTFVAEWLVNI